MDKSEKLGGFYWLLTIPKVERVICSSYFSYAKGFNENQYYSWGFGSGFVLGNGKEDSLFISNKVNNEWVFSHFPLIMSLGTNHITYVSS